MQQLLVPWDCNGNGGDGCRGLVSPTIHPRMNRCIRKPLLVVVACKRSIDRTTDEQSLVAASSSNCRDGSMELGIAVGRPDGALHCLCLHRSSSSPLVRYSAIATTPSRQATIDLHSCLCTVHIYLHPYSYTYTHTDRQTCMNSHFSQFSSSQN